MPIVIEEAHFTSEYIEKLRQILDASVSKEFANLSGFTSPDRDRVFWIERRRAEFQHLETTPTPSDAGLPLKDWAGPLPLDRERQQSQQRRGNCNYNARNHQISQAPHLI